MLLKSSVVITFKTKEDKKLLTIITRLAQKYLEQQIREVPNFVDINLGMNLVFNKRDMAKRIAEVSEALKHFESGNFAIGEEGTKDK